MSGCFFWLTEKRLRILLNAKSYKAGQHDVITVDTTRLVLDYERSMHLAAMNTGNTQPSRIPAGETRSKRSLSTLSPTVVREGLN